MVYPILDLPRLQHKVRHDQRGIGVWHVQAQILSNPRSDFAPTIEDRSLTSRVHRRWKTTPATISPSVPTYRLPALFYPIGDVPEGPQAVVQDPNREQAHGLKPSNG